MTHFDTFWHFWTGILEAITVKHQIPNVGKWNNAEIQTDWRSVIRRLFVQENRMETYARSIYIIGFPTAFGWAICHFNSKLNQTSRDRMKSKRPKSKLVRFSHICCILLFIVFWSFKKIVGVKIFVSVKTAMKLFQGVYCNEKNS